MFDTFKDSCKKEVYDAIYRTLSKDILRFIYFKFGAENNRAKIIHATFYYIDLNNPNNNLIQDSVENTNFYDFDQIENLPKPVLIDNYLKEGIF